MKNQHLSIACFQFTSNSVQLAASLEILNSLSEKENLSIKYFWLGSSTRYPSRMARGLDSFRRTNHFFPRRLKRAISSIKAPGNECRTHLIANESYDVILNSLMEQCSKLHDVREFSSLKFEGISPGGAIANSFVYETGEQKIQFSRNRALIELLIRSYLEVYLGVIATLKIEQPRYVVLYNGRFLHERATWDACRFLGIEVFLFETTRNRFHLRKDLGYHDRLINQKLMKDFWDEQTHHLSLDRLEELGSRYFNDLESKRNKFYVESDKSELKDDFFVFYSNSDDEAIGFWDTWREPFLGQIELIQQLQSFFDGKASSHLYVRLHPNLATKSSEEQMRWEVLGDTKNSTVIAPNDTMSSYALLKNAKGVISYGSTIGLEAAYHLVPSAILADCWYDELGVADKFDSLESLKNWVEVCESTFDNSLLQRRKRNALIRGLWLEMAGKEFANCRLNELDWGAWDVSHFNDVRIKRARLSTIFSILSNRFKRARLGLKK